MELEGVLAVRPDEVSAQEGLEVDLHGPMELCGDELDQRFARELLADDRRTLEDLSFLDLETIEARGDQRLDSRRQDELGARRPFAKHREHLLDEQGIPFR